MIEGMRQGKNVILTVSNVSPVASLTGPAEVTVDESFLVSAAQSVGSSRGSVNWGDGSETEFVGQPELYTHTYTAQGNYTITLTVYDYRNRLATASLNVEAIEQEVPEGKTVPVENDFTWIGAFKMPASIGVGDPQYSCGLAHRYVDDVLTFFSINHNPNVIYEMTAPELSMDMNNLNMSELVRNWGADRTSYGKTYGLFWDEVSERLLYTDGNDYNASNNFAPSVGSIELTPEGAVFEGIWQLAERSCKMSQGGILKIPSWFESAHCPDKRLGVGFGGYFSVLTIGPASMGPALSAINPAEFNTVPSLGAITNTPLLGYAYGGPLRCTRNPNYTSEFANDIEPVDGVGFWTWADWLWQGAVWIETATKSGILYLPTLGQDRVWYQNSTLNAEAGTHAWMMYDPTDLATVAAGDNNQDEIQPALQWAAAFPGLDEPFPGWFNEPGTMIVGSTFDDTTGILYIAIRFGLFTPPSSPVIVHAYQVAN